MFETEKNNYRLNKMISTIKFRIFVIWYSNLFRISEFEFGFVQGHTKDNFLFFIAKIINDQT